MKIDGSIGEREVRPEIKKNANTSRHNPCVNAVARASIEYSDTLNWKSSSEMNSRAPVKESILTFVMSHMVFLLLILKIALNV